MNQDYPLTPLEELQLMGMISADQHAQALKHPDYALVADSQGLPQHLMWLVCYGVVSEEQVKVEGSRIAHALSGEARAQHVAMMDSAFASIANVRGSLSCDALQALLATGIITREECDAAAQQRGPIDLLASPGLALAWMMASDILDEKRVAHMRRAAVGQPAWTDLLSEADTHIDGATRAALQAQRRGGLPGPRWAWIVGPVLAVALAGWVLSRPAALPLCADADVVQRLESPLLEFFAWRDGPGAPPKLGDIANVGVATGGVRACSAVLTKDGVGSPFAFTITPAGADQPGFIVDEAHPAMIKARYGSLDAEGRFIHQGEPVGRADLERALRDGALAFRAAGSQWLMDAPPASTQPVSPLIPETAQSAAALNANLDSDWIEIAQVEPMGPCRELVQGTFYSCPLLVERNDNPLRLGGLPSSVLEAEFTFERDDVRSPWRVSKRFPAEFSEAVIAAHQKLLAP